MKKYDQIKESLAENNEGVTLVEFGDIAVVELFGFEEELWVKNENDSQSLDSDRIESFTDMDVVERFGQGVKLSK